MFHLAVWSVPPHVMSYRTNRLHSVVTPAEAMDVALKGKAITSGVARRSWPAQPDERYFEDEASAEEDSGKSVDVGLKREG